MSGKKNKQWRREAKRFIEAEGIDPSIEFKSFMRLVKRNHKSKARKGGQK